MSGSGSYWIVPSQPRSPGKSDTASTPAAMRSQNCSGVVTPPGKRQLMATIAIGSSGAEADAAVTCPAPAPEPTTSVRRNWASAAGLG